MLLLIEKCCPETHHVRLLTHFIDLFPHSGAFKNWWFSQKSNFLIKILRRWLKNEFIVIWSRHMTTAVLSLVDSHTAWSSVYWSPDWLIESFRLVIWLIYWWRSCFSWTANVCRLWNCESLDRWKDASCSVRLRVKLVTFCNLRPTFNC